MDTGVPPTTSESVTGLGPVLKVTDRVPLSVTPGTFSAAVPLSVPATVAGVARLDDEDPGDARQ